MQQTIAQALAGQLAAWEVGTVFGVAGDDILPLLDALVAEGKTRFLPTAHEAGAAFMAANQARLTGELGVCMASAAGVVNLLEGLADAYLDGLPVLAITGQVTAAKIGRPVLQYYDQQRLVGTMSVFSRLVVSATSALPLFFLAVSQAMGRQSVSHLSFPQDIWQETIEFEPAERPSLLTGEVSLPEVGGDLNRAINLMTKAKRPLLVVGKRGRGAPGEIKLLAEVWGAAVLVAQEAKGIIPDSWPQVVGGAGENWLPRAVRECDCLLLLGSASYEEAFFPPVPVIQVVSHLAEVKEEYLWDALTGKISLILKLLAAKLDGYQVSSSWQETIDSDKKELKNLLIRDSQDNSIPIHPARFIVALNRVVAEDAIIALDTGAFNRWFDRGFQANKQQILLSSFWRSMGAGVPAANAAQVHCPRRQVIALVGDGGLLMSLGELAMAVKNQLPVKILVVRDRVYNLEKNKARAEGLAPAGLEVPDVDLAPLARACGALGFRIEEPFQLEATLAQALSESQTVLVEILCREVPLLDLR
ncbi:MAG TPA: thiamine pyrophosphate-binding protein [Clostridia bacterium]|nr:thiamine pyrophosphate-binding protein [Clostridia bacterium]